MAESLQRQVTTHHLMPNIQRVVNHFKKNISQHMTAKNLGLYEKIHRPNPQVTVHVWGRKTDY